MKIINVLTMIIAGLALVNCTGGTASPKSDDDKKIYSVAYETGKKLQIFQLSDPEMKVFRKGLEDGLKDKKEEVDVKQSAFVIDLTFTEYVPAVTLNVLPD